MKTASVQRVARRELSFAALLVLPIALGTAHCGTSTSSDPAGPTGGAAGSAGSGTGSTGGAAGSGGDAGSSGSADAASDSGEDREGGATADGMTTDRTGDAALGGCGYPTPPDPACYVAGSPPPTAFVRCRRPPLGIKDVMGETFRWHNGTFYWVNGTNIVRRNGSTIEAVTLSGDVASVFDVDDDAVYYLGPPSVERIFTNSGALIDATHLYWNEGTAPDVTLLRVAKGTTDVETVATHLPGPAVLLQGDSVLLVAEGKHILELPKSGGCPLGLLSSSSPPSNETTWLRRSITA
jgi:hypothetical protein